MEVVTEASREVDWDEAPAAEDTVGPPPGLAAPAAAASATALALSSSSGRATAGSSKSNAQRTRDRKQKKQQQTARELPHAASAQRNTQAAAAASSRPDVYKLKGFSSKRDATTASASDDDI